ncbi:rhombosortase [uncultured Methylibium sp.]|uniref:rhombosortase n=1 Tax=uncultured Methylibium sp. TaxID=381093 RepID=UPI0025E2BC76|nr:rhombosortase [uncultured Methylibium sp.]
MPSSAESRRLGSIAWCAVGALLALPALGVFDSATAARTLSWDPALWWDQPWRWWSAAWVHLSRLHLLANLSGAVLVVALGVTARLPVRAAVAWALAWPATHLGLLAMPELTRYGGLSGVLHAGVAVAATAMLLRSARGERLLGGAIAAVVVVKLLAEAPWRGPLQQPDGWDIAVAPLAHATGALAGTALALVCLLPGRRR